MRNLSITGNKNELIDRLQTALLDGDSTLDDSALNADDILDDDVLNDDDLDEDEEKSLLDSNHEDAVLKTPPEAKSAESSSDTVLTTKKVILKRKLNITGPSDTSITTTELASPTIGDSLLSPTKVAKVAITAPSATDSTTSSSVSVINSATPSASDENEDGTEKKVIKLSALTAKERLELRAKKFGVPIAPESAKLARSERFGTSAVSAPDSSTPSVAPTAAAKGNSASTIKANKEPATVDLLKKRAERFGGSVSKVMTKIENTEKLQKRNERFGAAKATAQVTIESTTTKTAVVATATTTTTSTPVVAPAGAKDEFAEKARLRLERFKTAVV